MHWSQTESSKCSLDFMANYLGHPFYHLAETITVEAVDWSVKHSKSQKLLL